jgi:DNA-3-methyladenine glycosylase II
VNKTIALPPGYRVADILAFHGRDAEGLAEQVEPARIRKGVMLDGVPVLLDVRFGDDAAACTVHADGKLSARARQLVDDALLNILALRIDPAPFLKAVRKDALLGPLAKRQPGLRIVQSATIFEALTWAIIGQQINLTFAIALRRTFIAQAGRAHSSGLWCYPEAADVLDCEQGGAGRVEIAAQLQDQFAALDQLRLAPDELTCRKFSRSKADTLLRLAQLVERGELVLELGGDLDATCAALLAVKGIGPWTVNYALLRGYGYADCSLHGDVAIRAALQHLLGEDSKPDMARTEALLAQYQPHRTMAAAHLWASLS